MASFHTFKLWGKHSDSNFSVNIIVPRDSKNQLNLLDLVKNQLILLAGGSDDDFFLGNGIKFLEVLAAAFKNIG